VFSFLVLQKDNSLSEGFCKISCNLFETKYQFYHTPSAKLCRHIWQSKVFDQKKGTRPAVSSVLRASFAALSDALFPQIPICPGTHIKTVSFSSALNSAEETAKRSEFGYTRE